MSLRVLEFQKSHGGQHLERPIFLNLDISNIKITRLDIRFFLFKIFLICLNYSNTQNIQYDNLQNWKFLEF